MIMWEHPFIWNPYYFPNTLQGLREQMRQARASS